MTPSALPPIAGRDAELLALIQRRPMQRAEQQPQELSHGELRGGDSASPAPPPSTAAAGPDAAIASAFACALHMHQPTIPAGAEGALISHLQWMFEHPGEGDNHNAGPFAHCYRRMADLLPELVAAGCEPRIMLDYSGTLLWGFEQMGRRDILEALRFLACDPSMHSRVEWLGTFWAHAVAPSTPIPDLRLQIQAWRHHVAALFGDEFLVRVQGFSLPEMALPNHPDTLFALVQALRECGYRWLLVQEHSVENPEGSPLQGERRHLPHRLVARSSSGQTAAITVLIKTQGSDTKLVGQMQPCYEALGLGPQELAGRPVPPLVSQIADGENGGVMMNEFPEAFAQAHRRLADQSRTRALNGSEYLDRLEAAGVSEADLPVIQAVGQQRLWQAMGEARGPGALEAAIAEIQRADPSFAMEGSSWTNDLSWVRGYANVLEPMQALSARFHQRFDAAIAADPAVSASSSYREALLHLLLLQTSCFRYWGQGAWTDYAREIHRRGEAALDAAGSAPP